MRSPHMELKKRPCSNEDPAQPKINKNNFFKKRDFTLPTKAHLGKAMVFPMSCMDVRVGL